MPVELDVHIVLDNHATHKAPIIKLAAHNEEPKPFVWTKSVDDILKSARASRPHYRPPWVPPTAR